MYTILDYTLAIVKIVFIKMINKSIKIFNNNILIFIGKLF